MLLRNLTSLKATTGPSTSSATADFAQDDIDDKTVDVIWPRQ
jgi:hypothetical protein